MAFPKPGLSNAERITVAAGGLALIDPTGAPWSLSVSPAAGATATVRVSTTPEVLIDPAQPLAAGGAVWHVIGDYTEAELIVFSGPATAVLVQATGGTVTVDRTA